MLPFNGRYLFCAFNERQLKKIIPIIKRRFIFLRQQDNRTTRQQVFGENVEGRFLLFLKLRNSKPQKKDTCRYYGFVDIKLTIFNFFIRKRSVNFAESKTNENDL